MSWLQAVARREERVLRWVNRLALRPGFGRTFAAVSRLGDGVLWYVLMGLIALLGGEYGRGVALSMVLTGLLAFLLYRGIKQTVARPRPCERFDDLTISVPPLDRWSFPSGHTMHAVSFTLVAVAAYPGLAWALIPFTVMVMTSRVVLGLHYPSDVLAGAGCGLLVVRVLAAAGALPF